MQTYFVPIFHITTEKEWEDCVDENYYPDAFSSEGFGWKVAHKNLTD